MKFTAPGPVHQAGYFSFKLDLLFEVIRIRVGIGG
jgi:hypothetical protein